MGDMEEHQPQPRRDLGFKPKEWPYIKNLLNLLSVRHSIQFGCSHSGIHLILTTP